MTDVLRRGAARAVADVTAGMLLASIEIKASPERVFRAIASEDIARWWGSPDLYRVTRWTGDLRVGGRWRSEGVAKDGKPFEVSGEYVEIDPPKKLVHSWEPKWVDGPTTKVTYLLEPIEGGTRLTVRHEGFAGAADACQSHAQGWERVFTWLSSWLERRP
jgi:uncharacterized protein YndB with AHSA1/START domain